MRVKVRNPAQTTGFPAFTWIGNLQLASWDQRKSIPFRWLKRWRVSHQVTLEKIISTLPTVGVVGTGSCRLKHTLPDLPYGYAALEPSVSKDIMTIHHQKHHATYINNLNAAQEKLAAAVSNNDVSQIISLQPALKFNGGGHINHSIFWEVLSPNGGGLPKGELMDLINNNFGSFDALKSQLSLAAVGVQGSGWAWLGWNPANGRLQVATCANQDPLQATTGLVPMFGIDVWEHAYYLQYKNVRPDYVKAMFDIANWEGVAKRLATAKM